MTLEVLETRVQEALSNAQAHAEKCSKLIVSSGLVEAFKHCQTVGIEAPKCSLTAQTDNAKKLRETTERKLSDPKWWKKSLESLAIQRYEAEQRALGNVTNFISDGLAAYTAKQKR